jgi:hypothetical protein
MRKSRRIFCFVLSLLMLFSLAPEPSHAAGTVIFTAANEKLYPLTDETMPFWSNGVVYVPQAALVDNDFGIQYSRSREKGTVSLYQLRNGIVFDLNEGSAKSSGGLSFIAQALVRGDTVFFPLDLLCLIFSLEYSYTRVTYGYLLRIKNDSVGLSDTVFIDAADPGMAQRYAQYERSHQSAPAGPSTPVDQRPRQEQAERTVYLSVETTDPVFSELLLSRLSSRGIAFLFSPQTLQDSGDLLRKLAALGGTIALRIDASSGAEDALSRIRSANDLLWNAASVKTRIVLLDGASGETLRAVSESGYCPLRFHLDYSGGQPVVSRMCSQIFSAADRSGGSCSVFLGTDSAALDSLPSLLSGFREGNCTPAHINEAVLSSSANLQNV